MFLLHMHIKYSLDVTAWYFCIYIPLPPKKKNSVTLQNLQNSQQILAGGCRLPTWGLPTWGSASSARSSSSGCKGVLLFKKKGCQQIPCNSKVEEKTLHALQATPFSDGWTCSAAGSGIIPWVESTIIIPPRELTYLGKRNSSSKLPWKGIC